MANKAREVWQRFDGLVGAMLFCATISGATYTVKDWIDSGERATLIQRIIVARKEGEDSADRVVDQMRQRADDRDNLIRSQGRTLADQGRRIDHLIAQNDALLRQSGRIQDQLQSSTNDRKRSIQQLQKTTDQAVQAAESVSKKLDGATYSHAITPTNNNRGR